jgi:RNA polymerase sigma-70 factor (ECF subfamily)
MNHSNEDVGCWLAAARGGSDEALGRLLQTYRQYLLLIAEHELDSALAPKGGASDLVQETFLEAQQAFARFHGASEDEFRAWLRRILLNNVANFTRKFKGTAKSLVAREVPLDPDSEGNNAGGRAAANVPSPSGEAVANEQARALQQALERLPEDYRRVLLWRYQEQLSFEEIAERLGRSANAARKLWARAVERLEQEMGPRP